MRRKSESFARRLSNFKICWPVKSSLERCATRWEKQAAVLQVADNNWLLRCGPKEPLWNTQTTKAWFPYRCICRICRVCRTKKIHRTDRIHSILYNKLYLSFLLYWAFVREVSIKLYLSHEFFSYNTHDRYNDMETRLKKRLTCRRYLRTWCQDVVSWGRNPDFGREIAFQFDTVRVGRERNVGPPDHMWEMSYPSDYSEMRLLKFFFYMGKLILLDFESLWIIISILPLCLYFTVPEVAGENPCKTNNQLP